MLWYTLLGLEVLIFRNCKCIFLTVCILLNKIRILYSDKKIFHRLHCLLIFLYCTHIRNQSSYLSGCLTHKMNVIINIFYLIWCLYVLYLMNIANSFVFRYIICIVGTSILIYITVYNTIVSLWHWVYFYLFEYYMVCSLA